MALQPANPPTNNALKLPSIVNPSTNKVIKRGRVKSPADLCSAWDALWWSDLESSQFRMKAQQWRDGMPPYSPRTEALMGTGGRTNVNWGLGDQIATDSEMPYIDLLEGVDTLFSMPTNWGSPSERVYVEQVMAEEITRMLRGWSQFDPLYQLNVRLFVDEGVSFVMFEDDYVWKWDVVGLQHLVFPRRIRADANELDIVMCQRQLLPHKLYEKCANEDLSASEGWNRDATWEAIKTAAQPTLAANDFQEWEMAWKNHDYILGQTAVTVEVNEGFVREVDGTISHYIGMSNGKGDFLYKKEGKFSDMTHLLVPYLYGVGANGTFHAIHGVLQKTFAAGMAQNKVINRMVDMAIHASTPYLKCDTEEAVTELPLTPMGQFVSMSPGYSWNEMQTPQFANALMPLIDQMNGLLRARSTPYTQTIRASGGNAPKTKYQQQSEDESQARLSSSGVTLFKNGLTMHYREVVRRVIKDPYPQSWNGGPEVQEFFARCRNRGVPEQAIREVDIKRIEVNMGIGKGSSAARRVAADSLNTLYPRADAKGQQYINYIVASSYTDASTAREIFPFQPGLRPPQDLEDANNENGTICQSAAAGLPNPIVVLDTQNHSVHLDSHIPYLDAINQQLQQGQMTLERAIPVMSPLLTHAEEHLVKLDPTSPSKPVYEEMLNKARMTVTNGARELYRLQVKAQREMEHNGVTNPEEAQALGGSPEGAELPSALLIQSAQQTEKLRHMQTDRAIRTEEFIRKQLREDAIVAAKIASMGLPKGAMP